MNTEVVEARNDLPAVQQELNPLSIIQGAIQSGIGADELGKLMDLQERYEAGQARKAFAEALSRFQAGCPVIRKNCRGDKATYADLAFTVKTIKPHLDHNGLSVRFDTELTAPNGNPAIMTATCYITHVSGHTETNSFSCPVDAGPVTRSGQKVMNSAQSTASARSYSKRYALGDALNLVFADEVDDDGAATAATPITDEQAAQLRDHIESLGIDEVGFLNFVGAPSIDEMPAALWPKAMSGVKAKQRVNGK